MDLLRERYDHLSQRLVHIKAIVLLLMMFLPAQNYAQSLSEGTPFHDMVERVTKFGSRIPQ